MNDTTPLFASKKQTAQRYGVHPKTIDRWRQRPDLRFPDPALTTGKGSGLRKYRNIQEQLIPWERSIKRAAE
jgi:hypothetical protein